ncbi:MAG: class I SAM-dependent methyltransferase [Treponema sp.]|nr:class I SAM-dependent methyltransferase [Treponema sp.]
MNNKSIYEKISNYYQDNYKNVIARTENALSIHRAENYKILGWESREAQYKRFAVLAEHINLDKKTLLDVGSGLGDLFHFLTQGLHWSVEYTGTDILPQMVLLAKNQAAQIGLPDGVNAKYEFLQTDIFENKKELNILKDKTFEVVYTSGIFNLNFGNNEEFLKSSFERFASIAEKYFVCSLLSDSSKNKEKEYFYYTKEIVLEAIKDVLLKYPSSNFKIVSDYLPNDMTVIWQK